MWPKCLIILCNIAHVLVYIQRLLFILFLVGIMLWYSITPLIRPPSESHWCGRIRGMVAHEGFRYAALLQRHTKYGRIRGMVVGEGGRSTGVLLYNKDSVNIIYNFYLINLYIYDKMKNSVISRPCNIHHPQN